MSDLIGRIDAVLAQAEQTLCACGCGRIVGPDSKSPWYADEGCQRNFLANLNNARPAPSRAAELGRTMAVINPLHGQRRRHDEFTMHGNPVVALIADETAGWSETPGHLRGEPIARWDHDAPVREIWAAPPLGSNHESTRLLGYRCVRTGCASKSVGTTDYCPKHAPARAAARRLSAMLRFLRQPLPMAIVIFLSALAGWFQ